MNNVVRNKESQQGFALVIVAALAIVVSLLAATALLSQGRKGVWQPKIDTKEQLAAIADALSKYQIVNLRLPCPAPRSTLPNAAGYATEGNQATCAAGTAIAGITRIHIDGVTACGVAPNPNCIRIGVVPTRTLGLPERYAADAWDNRISYAVMENFVNPTLFKTTVGLLRVNDAAGAAIISDAAYVLVSHGKDGKGAFSEMGGASIAACNYSPGRDQANCISDGVFIQADFVPVEGATFYDDHVKYNKQDATAKSLAP